MKILFGILLCLSFIVWSGVRIYNRVDYNIECGGHLKRAADANTVDLAKQELQTALAYIESHNMTSGYTSVLYKTPSEDVGFWYSNLMASFNELAYVKKDASQLETSNLLMKLRETILDQGKEGSSVTEPDGISIYPNNTTYAIWGWLSFVFFIAGCFFIVWGFTDY